PLPDDRTPALMPLKALILLTLLSRTPHHKDSESWESREARMELVASGIDASVAMATCTETDESFPIPEGCKPIWGGTQKSLAMLLVTQAVSEERRVRTGGRRARAPEAT